MLFNGLTPVVGVKLLFSLSCLFCFLFSYVLYYYFTSSHFCVLYAAHSLRSETESTPSEDCFYIFTVVLIE